MAHYLIIESRDLQEYTSGNYILSLADGLRKKGNNVTLFLVENGVLAARKGAKPGETLKELSNQGATIFAEDVALQSRGVTQLSDGVSKSNMDHLADLIASGTDKVIWY
jgi:sulfur relay (sulfurtransferase) complex TusBCD TusD component (DsrE family)